jgi:hypothetical protein
MTGEAELVRLLHRADWTRLSLSARVSNGSTLVVAPGKRYRLEAADYVRGCDGARPWELSDEDDDDDDADSDGEVHWISGPEPPLRDLLCPAWLLTGSRLEVRGRVRACGRDALDIVVTARPSFHHRFASDLRHGPVEAVVDAELGILLRVVQSGYSHQPETTEFVTADFEPDIDPAQFRPPPGSLRAESFSEAMGGGGLAWRATKTAAGLAAGGLGALIKYGPRPPDRPAPEDGIDIEPAIPVEDPAPQVSADGLPIGARVSDDLLNRLHAGGPGAFTATMHHWMDPSVLASRVPESARRAGFGGLGYLMDALGERDGAVRMTSTLRIAGPRQYQIDRPHQPRHGPVTIACDGQRCWQVYADKITTGSRRAAALRDRRAG